MNNEKECTVCHIIKPFNNFYNRSRMKDGKESQCKECSDARNIRYAKNNPDKTYKSKRKYLNKNHIRIKYNNHGKLFRNKHKLRTIASHANTCSIKKSNGELITAKQLWSLAKKQKMRCAISGVKLTNNNMSPDHIIPFCNGGKNVISNIQLVDKSINFMKCSHSVSEFLDIIKQIYLFNFSNKTN